MTTCSDHELIEVSPNVLFSWGLLRAMLTNAEELFFFAKLYTVDYTMLSLLVRELLHTDVAEALTSGNHSTELQDYLVDVVPPAVMGEVSLTKNAAKGEILPHIWEDLQVVVATSIADVANKLAAVVGTLPGKQGKMIFQSMMQMNKRRPTVGTHAARIHHPKRASNLIIFDVSGSMSAPTVQSIVDDVVALSYKADAYLAIVSNTCTYWTPGAFNSDAVLKAAEFGGTQYEKLAPLLNQDWGTVVTIADYDSSYSALEYIRDNATGKIDTVLDVSLVNRPTFLSECVGQLAQKVRPVLIGNSHSVLGSRNHYAY